MSPRRLPVLPAMRCDDGCGECCGVVPATRDELAAIRRYMAHHGVEAVDRGGLTCPFFDGKCTIYPVRPFICRAFGHVQGLDCPRGYNVNVPKRIIDREIRARGKAVLLLHSLIGPR